MNVPPPGGSAGAQPSSVSLLGWSAQFSDPALESEYQAARFPVFRRAAVSLMVVAMTVFTGWGAVIDASYPPEQMVWWATPVRVAWALFVAPLALAVAFRFERRNCERALFAFAVFTIIAEVVIAHGFQISHGRNSALFYLSAIGAVLAAVPIWSLIRGMGIAVLSAIALASLQAFHGIGRGDMFVNLGICLLAGAVGVAIGGLLRRAQRTEWLATREALTSNRALARKNEDLSSQLLQAQKMELIGQFSAGVAHDFNNILQSVIAYVEFALEDVPLESQLHDDLLEVQRAVDRGSELARQLLTVGRQRTVERLPIELDALVTELLGMLRRLIGARVELVFSPGLGDALIAANAGQLEQILLNLVLNARDATTDGGTIHITTSLDERSDLGGCARLDVVDRGVGIPESDLERIFEPFFTKKVRTSGTGLGLAMVRSIVETHGGVIEVHSRVGEGTTFSLWFPLTAGRGSRPVSELPAASTSKPVGRSVLIVEDEPGILIPMARTLRGRGFEVFEAHDGLEAMTIFEQRADDIDIVVTDIDVPALSGVELYRAMRKRQPDLPVVFASALFGDDVHEIVRTDSCATELPKPFRRSELLAKLEELG